MRPMLDSGNISFYSGDVCACIAAPFGMQPSCARMDVRVIDRVIVDDAILMIV